MKKSVCIVTLLLTLTACSSRYASNGESVYTRSQNGPSLVVPPPLTSDTISHFYDLPKPNGQEAVNLNPPE